MTTQVIILAVAAVAIIALLAARSGGPRVTQVDRTVRRKKDEREDAGDA